MINLANAISKTKTKTKASADLAEELSSYKLEMRSRRLEAVKAYGVRVEVKRELKKVYVMDNLVLCLPASRLFDTDFSTALRAVLDTLVIVQSTPGQ